jgi:phospholipase/carboxylesterase
MALDVATGEGAKEAGLGAVNQAEGMPLAALIACSGYPHPDWKPLRPRTRILLTHGEQDAVVPFAASTALEQQLREAGGTVERLAFAGGHGIEAALLPRLRSFLAAGWAQPSYAA